MIIISILLLDSTLENGKTPKILISVITGGGGVFVYNGGCLRKL